MKNSFSKDASGTRSSVRRVAGKSKSEISEETEPHDDRPRPRCLKPVAIVASLMAGSLVLPDDPVDRRTYGVHHVKGLAGDFRQTLLEVLTKADETSGPADFDSGYHLGRRDVHGVMESCSVEDLAVLFNRHVEKVGETTWRFHPDRSLVAQSEKALAA